MPSYDQYLIEKKIAGSIGRRRPTPWLADAVPRPIERRSIERWSMAKGIML